QGWFSVGAAKECPKHCSHFGHYCDTYIWVDPANLEGLTKFTLAIIDIATVDPNLVNRTLDTVYFGKESAKPLFTRVVVHQSLKVRIPEIDVSSLLAQEFESEERKNKMPPLIHGFDSKMDVRRIILQELAKSKPSSVERPSAPSRIEYYRSSSQGLQ